MLSLQGEAETIFDGFYRSVDDAAVVMRDQPLNHASERVVRQLTEVRALLDITRSQPPGDIWLYLEKLMNLSNRLIEESTPGGYSDLRYEGISLRQHLSDVAGGAEVLMEILDDQRERSSGVRQPLLSPAEHDHQVEIEGEIFRLSTILTKISEEFAVFSSELPFARNTEFWRYIDRLMAIDLQLKLSGKRNRLARANHIYDTLIDGSSRFGDIFSDEYPSLRDCFSAARQTANYLARHLLVSKPVNENNEHQSIPIEALEPPPAQQSGVQFTLEEGLLSFAKPSGTPVQQTRVDALLPLLQELVSHAVELFGRNQAHGRLRDALLKYQAAITSNGNINYNLVAAYGVLLTNAEDAAHRSVAGRLAPEFEDDELAAIRSILDLHGPLMLSTDEGNKFLSDLRQFKQTTEQQEILRSNVVALAEAISADKLATDATTDFIVEVAAQTSAGPDPVRSSYVSSITARNVSTVLLAGAILVVAPLTVGATWISQWTTTVIIGEGIKRSKLGQNAAGMIKDALDDPTQKTNLLKLAPFVLKHEDKIRAIVGDQRELAWLIKWLEWIKANAK